MGYARRAMATDEETPEPQPCSACRGTGKVISNLGGSPSTVTCPWCEGTGQFIPDHDAQAARRESS
jgi:DnaJ-class molecular chaperone